MRRQGTFWDRPRLTGDGGGFRDQAAKRGVTLDVDWLQVLPDEGLGVFFRFGVSDGR